MEKIVVKQLTKKFDNNFGCFKINFNVNSGEVYGFLGPNGAGKTTVIRQLVGFVKPDSGEGIILKHNIWSESQKIMKDLGYVPGEIFLPQHMVGIKYLKSIAEIRGNVDWNYVTELISYFDFNPNIKIKKMSKGTKQKIALISAFMHKPKILILDEPTSGLDPLMQQKFNFLIDKFKKKGTSIFLSSHIFGEIEFLCDKVSIIKKGKIISEENLKEIKEKNTNYEVKFKEITDFNKIIKEKELRIVNIDKANKILEVSINNNEIDKFLKKISNYSVDYFKEVTISLEKNFMKFYEEETKFND